MRKRFLLAFLLLLMLPLITGCHGTQGNTGFSLPDELDSGEEIRIVFWAKNDTNKTQTEIYNRAAEEFHTLYPNVTVNIKLYTDYTKIYNDVITNIATGTTPNVCITYPDHIATYITGQNVVVPLDSLINDPDWGLGGRKVGFDAPKADEIVPEFLDECRIGGTCYALPYMRSTEACYVNKTYVEKLGYTLPDVLTWDFVWEVSEKAMEKDADGNFAVNGQKVMVPFIYKSTDNMMISMLKQLDGAYSDENGQILLFNETTSGILKEIFPHAQNRAFSTFKISSYPANFLNAGQCIFAVDSTAGATWMGSDAPLLDISADSIVPFETAVLPIPQMDPAHPQMISQGPSVCLFSKQNAQENLASWLFMQYLLTNGTQIAYAETEGYIPVTRKAYEDPVYQDYLSRSGEDNQLHYRVKLDASRLMLENTDKTFITPVFNGSASLRSAAGQLIEEVTKSARRKGTMSDEYLQGLYSDLTSMYHLEEKNSENSNDEQLPDASKALLVILVVFWVGVVVRKTVLMFRHRHST